ncbi:MAG: hypothetical protein IJ242_10985, partial [Clostridia bacterium]|nr:hypothetical protein [Clostridia bacterium]
SLLFVPSQLRENPDANGTFNVLERKLMLLSYGTDNVMQILAFSIICFAFIQPFCSICLRA